MIYDAGMTPKVKTHSRGPKIEAFLSYSHESDSYLNLSKPLCADLVTMIKMRSNRDVEIFLDRDDLKWGQRFRESIDNGLTGATVLFVIATAQYLDSEFCRKEFLQFLNAAKAQGSQEVKRLILPIMPVNAEGIFVLDSDDEIASEIAEIQYEPIEEAVLEGPGSPAWRRSIARLADRFLQVVEAAETELEQERAEDTLEKTRAVGRVTDVADAGDEYEEDQPGVFDDLESITDVAELVTADIHSMGELLNRITETVTATDLSKASSAKEMNNKLSLVAKRLEPTTKEISLVGINVRDNINHIDVAVRRLAVLAKDDETGIFGTPIGTLLESMSSSLGTAQEVEKSMSSLLASLGTPEAASSLMRKALKPMRVGVVAFGDGIRVLQEWGPKLLD